VLAPYRDREAERSRQRRASIAVGAVIAAVAVAAILARLAQ
jgi:hypothetical protein